MIIKYFEINKKNLSKNKSFLLYGNNKGLIEEIIESTLKPILPKNIFKYDETEILNNIDEFKQNIFTKSFFEDEKLYIINRVSDKSFKLVEEILSKNLDDFYIVLLSQSLDKKSKIRKYFETNKTTICIPVYEDNFQILNNIAQKFSKEKKLNLSQQIINIIVERAAGDRINLKNELTKLYSYSLNKKKIELNDIIKITNLSENYSISELVDYCLSKNKIKMTKILNENNFNSEDCILILRTFLIKLKRLFKLQESINLKKESIEDVMSLYRPPIFWKEKDIIKKQITTLKQEQIKELMEKVVEIELLIKKNPQSSINITTDFVINQI
tara:strand:+ start:1082 stop:2065 length:984 start_codon:yes stop_codon:yes gene_type:complete